MKARIIEQPAKIYGEADMNSPALMELAIGRELELGAVTKKDGKDWVAVTLPTGQRGYVSGDTRIYHIKRATLLQGKATVFVEPKAQSIIKTELQKNAQFYLLDVIKQENREWVKVRDLSGNEGFIDGATKIKVGPETAKATKAAGRKNMLYGALWLIGGIVVTVVSYSAASGGGTYLITWGAIIFGGFQFVQGLYQYMTASE